MAQASTFAGLACEVRTEKAWLEAFAATVEPRGRQRRPPSFETWGGLLDWALAMLAFLHTAAAHVPNFTRIARDLDASVPIRHVVREDLLAQAIADGRVTDETRRGTQTEVQRLVADGASVVLCTCSTLGSAAEETPHLPEGRVVRVDRPMAERAAALGRPILLVATTPTAMTTAVALLSEVARDRARLRELLCSAAWERFQAGDQAGYARALAEQVDEHARPNDVVMLVQASMAPAAALIRRSDVEVLTSPDAGVRAALALLATVERAARPTP